MDVSDGIDKSWDHPWTTEEMRKKRREWSLAGDVGLLKHLQQFSENLVSKANKTQAALDTLTTQLKETGILVDNVTNTSLALANTQFIESRVQEDDIEIKENLDEKQENAKTQESTPENLLASISESVKQGLSIMDEKYKVMDVACSDSEEEDEGGAVVFSVIVGPNDPYQDRPLPYVIGSDKWIASNKIGLESSSSESEQADEERDESESEKEDTDVRKVFNSRHNPEINIARLSSSSSDSDNYNDHSNNISYENNKTDIASQNNINSASESATPNNVSKSNETAPNFAEELAKRLGTVRQAQKPVSVDEISESSINRFKDDLFASEKDEDVFNGSDNLFSDKKDLFDDQVSANLWKEKPIKSYKNNNIIPASIDVPPPISIVSTKPKSAIDDLFADADSEEDSDDIFSSKNVIKKRPKEPVASDNAYPANMEDLPKKFLDVIAPGKIATSTPESNIVNATSLFSDDENDDADLFGNSKKQSHKPASAPSSTNTTQESSKKKPIGGEWILGNVLASDIESKLSSRIMQRRQESSESSDSDATGNFDSATRSNIESTSTTTNHSSQNPAENLSAIGNTTSSGVSMQPPSIDITAGSSLSNFPSPCMSSTRVKSEEIYRERITSDSLFTARTYYPANANSANANSDNQQQQQQSGQEQQGTSSALLQDDVFENDDLFGPPPLPSKSDSKRTTKSKVSSLFDDSDSGDEFFSAASSGSRSQKSTDFHVTVSSNDRTKSVPKSGGLFDDDVDIFGRKDAPDVDIFGAASKSGSRDAALNGPSSVIPKSNNDNSQNTRMEPKKISLFDDDDDGDLFGAKPTKLKNERKTDLFEDEDDLFLSTKASLIEKDVAVKPKIDMSKNVSSLETEKKNRNDPPDHLDELFSKTTRPRSLLFEDDDYDDLFGKKDTAPRDNDQLKSKEEVSKDIAEQAQKLSEENKSQVESLNLNRDVKATVESSVVVRNDVDEEKSEAEIKEISSNIEEDGIVKKNSPPKTLSIRTISPPPEEHGNQQAPRRLVSGKIKNLMGKMGDLKILSPMDAPPLWRRSEDKTDEEEDIVDRDIADLGVSGHVSPPSISEGSTRKESSYSTISTTSNAEAAINFDDLAQVETLSTTASKSRVRIQAKRRPQSRHARKSALRHSGIDFDTVDNADNDNSQEESHTSTCSSSKDPSAALTISVSDRLIANDNIHRSAIDPASTDDRSELGSISKESSMSVNKNTLLSPSTDEEDLFDVPPDLPEDPQKEDALFGRAPILSPIDGGQSDKTPVVIKPLIDTVIRKVDEIDVNAMNNKSNKQNSSEFARSDVDTKSDTLKSTKNKDDEHKEIDDEQGNVRRASSEEPSDPLRDSTHDPLKDPSQLFAFVTKTPSPEKSKGLLFSEPDDSLFSSGLAKKPNESKKKILDLFAEDDMGGDLFSTAPLKKTVKKPLRDTKIDLFGDDVQNDDDDSLFGNSSSKAKLDTQPSNSILAGRKKNNIFDDDDDDDSSLFIESSGHSQKSDSASFSESKQDSQIDSQAKSSNLKDIFGNAPHDGDDDDIDLFATKKVVPKKVVAPSKSLFASDDDDDDGHIFGKQPSASMESKVRTTTIASSSRSAMKKPVTKDLKKTAEKIIEDPLSLLQDD
ncbi:PREDICTED: WASH complex subunit FAM21 homolog isoform X2 [Trachymyrmex cornetzi]|uniref:WASH complex subunit FAM21 n=1 Tax=Trachymyrmex cornetzi TaxID=471704 RepID=A0A195EHP9_9HYME|nr:PREDICTED: WASH complex subunit FAM21 homolog isoform X2 [Trachymyrmex cornetzi]KYN27785.1 WASH complex subunit FAM21 [Trachymyrmex cornetzi]